MRSVETEGATIDEAIDRALEMLQVSRERVEVEILENSMRGLLGFGGRKARVRATVRRPLTVGGDTPVGDEDENVSGETDVPTNADSSAEPAGSFQAAREVLSAILDALEVEARLDFGTQSGVPTVSISGSDTGIVIGRHGQTLDAIEYMVNRIAVRRTGAMHRICVDVEGYRDRRQESLEQTALRLAEKVRQTGRPAVLNPMRPRDRRIVHLALSGERGIKTRSEGEGELRRVVILPIGA